MQNPAHFSDFVRMHKPQTNCFELHTKKFSILELFKVDKIAVLNWIGRFAHFRNPYFSSSGDNCDTCLGALLLLHFLKTFLRCKFSTRHTIASSSNGGRQSCIEDNSQQNGPLLASNVFIKDFGWVFLTFFGMILSDFYLGKYKICIQRKINLTYKWSIQKLDQVKLVCLLMYGSLFVNDMKVLLWSSNQKWPFEIKTLQQRQIDPT